MQLIDKDKVFRYEGQGTVACRGCRQQIYFVQLKDGPAVPVSAATNKHHSLDCPNWDSVLRSPKNRAQRRRFVRNFKKNQGRV